MMSAKDLMSTGTPTLSFDETVTTAIEKMKGQALGFIAVMASQDRYHGVITEAGLMRAYLRLQTQPEKQALIFYRDCFEPTQLVHESEDFSSVVKKIMTSVGHRVFVINDRGEVQGHISAKDILPYFSISPQAGSRNPVLESQGQLNSDMYLYESFFAKSPFMMHSVDFEGKILMANEMLHLVLGYDYGELISKTIFHLYPKSSHEQAKSALKTIKDRGFHQVVEGQMVAKSGVEIDVELVSRALYDPQGKALGTMTVSRPRDMSLVLKALPYL